MNISDMIDGFVSTVESHCERLGGKDWRRHGGNRLFDSVTEMAWKEVFSNGKMNRGIYHILCAYAHEKLLPGIKTGHYRIGKHGDIAEKIVQEIIDEIEKEDG